VTEEGNQVRKHLITEHGELEADVLGDALAAAEHYSQHFSPDGGITPAKGTWDHPFTDLSYNPAIDEE
jgi:hypothetical protein